MKNCQLCEILVLSDAQEAVAASGCFEEQLWMGNYCPGKNHSRRPWRGYCSVAPRTLSVVQLRLTRVSERHLPLREHIWQGWKMDSAIRHPPSTRKVKNDAPAGQCPREKKNCKMSFSVLQNASQVAANQRELWPFVGSANIPAIWAQLRITRH